jgi:hypothetical protein
VGRKEDTDDTGFMFSSSDICCAKNKFLKNRDAFMLITSLDLSSTKYVNQYMGVKLQ